MNFENDIINCLEVLKKGGIILYPTDTVWGIGCDATIEKPVEKIYNLKNRSDEKSMIVLMADEKDILQYVARPDLKVFDYLRQVSKPTSVVYENVLGFAHNLVDKSGSIAIRICSDPFCKQLIKRFRKPIVSTSANISGKPAPAVFKEISEEIKNGVDYIVQYRQDDERISEPSAVIKWNSDGTVKILRP
jgi:L-threonylcarbamoyladenylate synthase